MVRTFTDEEPSSFETLWSQFSVLGDVPNWDSDQTECLSSLGTKVRNQTIGSLEYAFWAGMKSINTSQGTDRSMSFTSARDMRMTAWSLFIKK